MDVIISVDVEDPYYPGEMYRIWGQHGRERFGIPLIDKILRDFGLIGAFFVDVYERAIHSDKAIEEVLQYLTRNGHEVNLHTHPGVDVKRYGKGGMSGRSIMQQTDIVGDGIDCFERCTGTKPHAHRAGSYMVDDNTLIALKATGIKCDSSLYHKSPNCRISTAGRIINDLYWFDGLIEVPISMVWVISPLFQSPVKLDIEQDFECLVRGLEAMRSYGASTAVLFLHSWSFLSRYAGNRLVRGSSISKFTKLCQLLSSEPGKYRVRGFAGIERQNAVTQMSTFPVVRLGLGRAVTVLGGKMQGRLEELVYKPWVQMTKARYGF